MESIFMINCGEYNTHVNSEACKFISGWYERSCAGFCRCQMCLHPLSCSRLPSLWFLQRRRVSIRAPGLQEPEHSSLSVQPREAQPCLGRCICSPGASWGKRANPGAPCTLLSLEMCSVSTAWPFNSAGLESKIQPERLLLSYVL